MICTSCENCCFLQKDDGSRKCVFGRSCHTNECSKVYTPGYCRLHRKRSWAVNQSSLDIKLLSEQVLRESWLKFDIIVIFDEKEHAIEDLQATLNTNGRGRGNQHYAQHTGKIIIADVTEHRSRKHVARQYMGTFSNRHAKTNPVDICVDEAIQAESVPRTIRRVSRLVGEKFFLVVRAGHELLGISKLADNVQYLPNKCVMWVFPKLVDGELLVDKYDVEGLHLAHPYRKLGRQDGKVCFAEQLRDEEEGGTTTPVIWICGDCWMVHHAR